MAVELITKQDLDELKTDILNEIRQLVKPKQHNPTQKEWLKSYEVRKLLSISPGKLQNMRINGTIAYTRIGGLMFYKYDDIVKLMDENKTQRPLIARQMK